MAVGKSSWGHIVIYMGAFMVSCLQILRLIQYTSLSNFIIAGFLILKSFSKKSIKTLYLFHLFGCLRPKTLFFALCCLIKLISRRSFYGYLFIHLSTMYLSYSRSKFDVEDADY